jgi:hypothetical protein
MPGNREKSAWGGETDRILRVNQHPQGPIEANSFRPLRKIDGKVFG